MHFIAKILPIIIIVGALFLNPVLALVLVASYIGWKWAELGDKAHIGALAKEAGSDIGWAHRSAEENIADGLLWAKTANAEGKLAFMQSDEEYAKGYTAKYSETQADYTKERKEWREQRVVSHKAMTDALANL